MNTNSLPQQRRAVSVAFLLGASDGESGSAFAPEMFYVHRSHKIQYALGFERARGVSEMTHQFTGSVIFAANKNTEGK